MWSGALFLMAAVFWPLLATAFPALAGDPLLSYAPAWPAGSAPLRELLEP